MAMMSIMITSMIREKRARGEVADGFGCHQVPTSGVRQPTPRAPLEPLDEANEDCDGTLKASEAQRSAWRQPDRSTVNCQ